MLLKFAKYEGAGNDFILLDDREERFTPDPARIARLCDRHFGIGADGLMTLRRSSELDCSMRYYNADGSEGEMCGNGARCFTLFAEHLGVGGEVKFACVDGPDFDGHKVDWDESLKRGKMYFDWERHKYEETCNLFSKEVQ